MSYKYLAIIAAFVAWTAGAYFFGSSVRSDKCEIQIAEINAAAGKAKIAALEAQSKQFDELQSKADANAKDAWSKYNEAQKELDNATADSERWRVRYQTKPSNCSVQTTDSGSVGHGERTSYAELPPENQRGLEGVGDEATKGLKQCRIKVDYLQGIITAERE